MAASIVAAFAVLVVLSGLKGPSSRLEGVLDDFRHWTWMVVRGPTENDVSAPVVVVDVDERSLRALGVYGENYRVLHAQVLDFLSRHGAGAVVFDILFKTSDSGAARMKSTLEDLREAGWPVPSSPRSRERLRLRLDWSRRLEVAVGRAPRAVVAAQLGNKLDYPNPSDWIPRASRSWQDSLWKGIPLPDSSLARLRSRATLDNLYPGLARAASRLGLANVEPDPDGTVRRIQLLWRFPDTAVAIPGARPAREAAYPALSLSSALLLLGRPANGFRLQGNHLLLGAPLRIWKDTGGIRTSAPELTWPMCQDILASRAALDSLRRARSGVLEPTRQLWIDRDGTGTLRVALAYPDSLDDARVRALAVLMRDSAFPAGIPSSPGFSMPTDSVAASMTPGGLVLSRRIARDSFEAGPALDSATLERLHKPLLALSRNGWKDFPRDSEVRVSNWIEIWWDPVRRRLDSSIPSLRGSSLDALLASDPARIRSMGRGDTLALGDAIVVPLDGGGAAYIPFQAPSQWENRGPDQAWIRHVSYLDVLEGRYDPDQIPGRIFVLGSSAPALADFIDVPIQRHHPGVNLQATEALALAWGDSLAPVPAWVDLFLVLLAALVMGFATVLLPPGWAVFSLLLLAPAFFAGSTMAFDRGIWIQQLGPMLAMPFALVAVLVVRYVLEERQRKFLHTSFSTYISPELIDQMVSSGMLPRLGGEEREITAFFSDIQGFSTFSEVLSPSDLVELINQYFKAMTDILTRHEGCLDKYIGDAIVAMFGAPIPLPDHPRHALLAAIAMQERLARLREKWENEAPRWPEIVHRMRMRIGVHTGRIVTGNMGSDLRMNYTMMGDDVNLAARLEGASKQYGVWIMTTSATLGAAGAGILSRELDLLRVVGREEAVAVHEILGLDENAPGDRRECVRIFGQARESYKAGDFGTARDGFLASLELEPNRLEPGAKTNPSAVFAARCASYMETPPSSWDGIHTAKEK
jgi:adenylate cyclase